MLVKLSLKELSDILSSLQISNISDIQPHPEGISFNLKSIPLILTFPDDKNIGIRINSTKKLLVISAEKLIPKLLPKYFLPNPIKIKEGLRISIDAVLEYLFGDELEVRINSVKMRSEKLEINMEIK